MASTAFAAAKLLPAHLGSSPRIAPHRAAPTANLCFAPLSSTSSASLLRLRSPSPSGPGGRLPPPPPPRSYGGGSGGSGDAANSGGGEGGEGGILGLFLAGWAARVAADPQFLFKVLMEKLVGVTACVLGDMASRPNFGLNELDFVFSTLVVGSILNFVLMYLLAPAAGADEGFDEEFSLGARVFPLQDSRLKTEKLHQRIRRHLQPCSVKRDGVFDTLSYLSLTEYCQSESMVSALFQPGEKSPSQGEPPRSEHYLLSEAGQHLIRSMFMIEKDLFDQEFCLYQVIDDTFVVDQISNDVFLSKRAYASDLIPVNPSEKENWIARNMKDLAGVLQRNVFRRQSLPVDVTKGLLPLMMSSGHDMLPVIINHPSLVPIGNWIELSIRLYNQLKDVVGKKDTTKRNRVQKHLKIPYNWHDLVLNNEFLKKIYQGCAAGYGDVPNFTGRQIPKKNPVQQCRLAFRFVKNAGSHGLERSIDPVSKDELFTRLDIALMLYTVFPQLLHSVMVGLHNIGYLQDLALEDLFNYTSFA